MIPGIIARYTFKAGAILMPTDQKENAVSKTPRKALVKDLAAWLALAVSTLGTVLGWIDGESRHYPGLLLLAAGWLFASARVTVLENELHARLLKRRDKQPIHL